MIWSPSEETLEEYRSRGRDEKNTGRNLPDRHPAHVTEDRVRISLGANINFSGEVKAAAANGCESIGLYRTDSTSSAKESSPYEDSLLADYLQRPESCQAHRSPSVRSTSGSIKRAVDGVESESRRARPAVLSWRTRTCSRSSSGVCIELRSAADCAFFFRSFPRSTILMPRAKCSAEVRGELDRARQPYDSGVPIGRHDRNTRCGSDLRPDGFAGGFLLSRNERLIQYYLVIDRSDQSVMHLYNPFHPAILRCLHQVYTLLQPTGKPITVCGEMAADPPSAAVLLGWVSRRCR